MSMRRKNHFPVADVVNCVREHGPITCMAIANVLARNPGTIKEKVREAKYEGLLARVGKDERGHFVYAAVQQRDWPQQEQQ